MFSLETNQAIDMLSNYASNQTATKQQQQPQKYISIRNHKILRAEISALASSDTKRGLKNKSHLFFFREKKAIRFSHFHSLCIPCGCILRDKILYN